MPAGKRTLVELEPSLRPRERLFRAGPEALTDAQLVALFLGSGDRGENVIAFAGRLLEECGGIRGLLSADPNVLLAKRGLGAARVAMLKAALELTGRYLAEGLERRAVLNDPAAAKRYLQVRLDAADREVFAGLFLDAQHRVLGYEELFFGTVDGAPVYPREVVKAALKHNAAALIVAHNHPSGVAEPSAADVALTTRLKNACELVDVRLIDHVVIGRPDAVSLAERGLI